MLVLKICPDFLKHANKFIDKKINITGTNGKTTTSGIVSHLLKKKNLRIINNAKGANMLTGVVNAISISLNPFVKSDFSVIESDEAYLSKIYDKFDADYLLVTNLFRDQLDRYGELAKTKALIQEAIDKKSALKLILNADDPLVSSFDGKNKVFYGIENIFYADGNEPPKSLTEEAFNCPCGKPLNYSKKFYAQQGHYFCECGYRRPDVKYKADVTIYRSYLEIKLDGTVYKVPLVGVFNAYNALGAIALLKECGIKDIETDLTDFQVAFGRSEVKSLNHKKTLIQLIKNPIGANEVLKTVDLDSNILIIINDNYADGRDVSWLWDAEFEVINKASREITVSGTRALDMALRLKYAGVENIKVISDIDSAVDYVSKTADNDITILPTYTALLKINKNKKFKRCEV